MYLRACRYLKVKSTYMYVHADTYTFCFRFLRVKFKLVCLLHKVSPNFVVMLAKTSQHFAPSAAIQYSNTLQQYSTAI